MSFSWKHFIDVAEYLINHPLINKEEAFYRSAISRAYYAAYWKSKRFLAHEGKHTYTKKIKHEELLRILKQDYKSLGHHFNTLFTLRNSAEYNTPQFTKEVLLSARKAVDTAEIIYSQVDRLITP